MKHGKNATKRRRRRQAQTPYAMLGAGPLAARISKRIGKGNRFAYRFNVFRMCADSGRVSQLFVPDDIPHFASLVRLLAFEIANDGCLDAELRDDLLCFASCLDEVLGQSRRSMSAESNDEARLPMPRSVASSIEQVLDYLWEDEAKAFRDNPCLGHIYRSLAVIQCWLDGSWSSDEILASFEDLEPSDYFGVCPICGTNDGYLNLQRSSWFVCHKYRLRWCAGDLFSTWKDETVETWRRNWDKIKDYRLVEPYRLRDSDDTSKT